MYYQFGNQIIIPCYNDKNELIGIRARNLDPNASCKYVPYKDIDWRNGDKGWYKFNVGSTFFGLNHNLEAIRKTKKVIICESEKAVMQGDTYFGKNNIILGMYGSAMTITKRDIVLDMGIDEVIIAIDFDYDKESYHNEELYEDLTEWEIYERKVYKIADKFKGWCKVSVIIDFNPEHKKALPKYPGTIGIVTSSAGAAVHDMLRILKKRYPLVKVKLLPVRVQGVEAPGEIAAAIIEIKEGFTCTEEDIEKFCMKMPRYKRPKKIIFADIPRNPTGKIEKPKLREKYGADKLIAEQNMG